MPAPQLHLRAYLWLLAILLIILAIVLFIGGFGTPFQQNAAPPVMQAGGSITPPLRSDDNTTAALSAAPFDVVVSYVNDTFQPSSLTISQGQTVRFVNNSTDPLEVSSTNQYPGTSSCDTSAFDSCTTLNPGDYWQFSFGQPGTWTFNNDSNTSAQGTITVQ